MATRQPLYLNGSVVQQVPAGDTIPAAAVPDLSGTYQPLDSDLTAIAALTSNGLLRKNSGTWQMQSTPLAVTLGGSGLNAVAAGSILYASSTNTMSELAANATATRKFLRSVSGGSPAWDTLVAGDIPDLSAGYATPAYVNSVAGGWLVSQGRLAMGSDPAADAQGATLYYLPYTGSRIALYDTASTSWLQRTIPTGLSLNLGTACSAGSGVYDVYVAWNTGSSSMALSVTKWGSVSARGYSLAYTGNGGRTHPTNLDMLWVGTLYWDSSTCYDQQYTTSGSVITGRRYLFNTYNRMWKCGVGGYTSTQAGVAISASWANIPGDYVYIVLGEQSTVHTQASFSTFGFPNGGTFIQLGMSMVASGSGISVSTPSPTSVLQVPTNGAGGSVQGQATMSAGFWQGRGAYNNNGTAGQTGSMTYPFTWIGAFM